MTHKTVIMPPRVKGKPVGPESAVGPSVEYVRIPGPYGICPITSMKRESMLNLVMPRQCNDFRPPVKSVLIKRPGAKRGSRYINAQSLRDFMASLEAQAS